MFKNKLIVLVFFYITSVFTAEKSEQELEKNLTKTQIAEYQSATSIEEKEKIFKTYFNENCSKAKQLADSLEQFLIFENLETELKAEKAAKGPISPMLSMGNTTACYHRANSTIPRKKTSKIPGVEEIQESSEK